MTLTRRSGRAGTKTQPKAGLSLKFGMAWLVLLLVGALKCAGAQFDSGAVLGNIKDPSGAIIASAQVELLSVARGTKVARQTDSGGGYEFDSVQPGDYMISVTAQGFELSKTDIFRVNVGARQRVDLALKLGAASDTVTVSGAATLLETDTSDRGETVQGTEAVALPLNGRSYADLAQLVPGVRRSLIATVASVPPRDASYNVNGLTSMDNNFTLDGIDNNAYQEANQGYSNQAVIPSPDALSEFKVQTDNYSAEYGRAGGAIINASTRSGTNQFHGGVYDYLRNTVLNAFGPFYGTGIKPTLVQNQFGATFGGPAGGRLFKDKLFFFMDYEGLRSVQHTLTTATLPTPAELTGLFTSDGTATGTPVPVKNPYTGTIYANGQVPLTDPNINPVALETFKYLPAPNIPGAALTAANFQYLAPATTIDDKGDGRADYILNPSQNGFVRYSQRAVSYQQPAPFPGIAGGNSNGTLYARTRQIAAGWNWNVTPNSMLELRFGQTWTQSGKRPIFLGATNFYTAAGISGVNIPTDPAYTGGLNAQAVSGFTAFGEQTTNPQFNDPTTTNPRINYTWAKGHHSLKAGYELGIMTQAISDFHPKYGSDIYSGAFSTTAGSTSQAANLTDFLFGARNQYSLNNYNEINYQRFWHFGYIQDDWKALPNLTINAGLRYEFMSPNYEQNDAMLNYDPVNQRLVHAGNGTDVTSTAAGHIYSLHYVGGGSLGNRGLVNPDYKGFAPRFGFSYQPFPKTVLRGGYASSFAYLFRFGGEGMLGYNGPNNYDAIINQTSPTSSSPQPLCVTVAGSTAASLTLDPSTCFRRTQDGYENSFDGPVNFSTLKAQTRYQLQNFATPYVEAYHLSAQQELPLKFTLELAYVGEHGVHIAALVDTNQARLCLPTEVPTNAAGQCTTNLQARRPISTFTDILTETNLGFLDYNSLQTKLERRFNNGVFLINSFTWSHGINNSSADLEANNGDSALVNIVNPTGDRGSSGYNQPLNNTTSVIADVPFGRGKRFGASVPGWEQQILGGWQLTGINIVTSGVPINITYSASTNQVVSTTSSVYALRPNLIGATSGVYGHNLVKTNSSLNGYLVSGNGSSVSIPTGTQLFGNAPRNALHGPAFGQFDLAAHKKFTLAESRLSAEFRIEAFNVFNATNYITPTTSVGSVNSNSGAPTYSGSFGQFTGGSSVYPSRQVQMALRLAF